MPSVYFITGTDTGVGKTIVTSCLVAALRARGQNALALKPFETGCWQDPTRDAGHLTGEDSQMLARASGDPTRDVGYYRFIPPLGPSVAARLAGTRIELPPVLEWIQAQARAVDVLLVEGVGGMMVPLQGRQTVLDFMHQLKPTGIILVSVNRLGVLSQVLTAVKVLEIQKLPLASVVLNPGPDPAGLAEQNNVQELEQFISPVVLCPQVDSDALNHRAWCGEILLKRLGPSFQ